MYKYLFATNISEKSSSPSLPFSALTVLGAIPIDDVLRQTGDKCAQAQRLAAHDACDNSVAIIGVTTRAVINIRNIDERAS